MCWFALNRNIWGLLATSHDTITANENLANKPHFWGGLLANLVDILRPAYAISIIFKKIILFLPHNIASHWSPWMIVEKNELLVNLMCFELPRNLDVWSLHRLTLPHKLDFLLLIVHTVTV